MTEPPVPAALVGQLKPLYKISELTEVLPFSRSLIYGLVRAGRLRTVTEHSTRYVSAGALVEYLTLLEKEAA